MRNLNKPVITLIGAGHMGGAILQRLVQDYTVQVCEKDAGRAAELQREFHVTTGEILSVVPSARAVIVAVKPQDMDVTLTAVGSAAPALVISIAAGVTTRYIEQHLPSSTPVIRGMPNLPAQIGQGMTALCEGTATRDIDMQLAQDLFDRVGKTILVGEDQMDAVTAVSGSGPAYVFYFLECLRQAAEGLGLEPALAQALVDQTVKGSVALWAASGADPADLRRRVTSKGGTTAAALEVFSSSQVPQIFEQAVAAAQKRARELARDKKA